MEKISSKELVAELRNRGFAVSCKKEMLDHIKKDGYAVLNSKCPREELYEIILDNDCIKIDGNNAVCWSDSLEFTVERSGKSLIGSAASGEGLVNVYRGSGKILLAPTAANYNISPAASSSATAQRQSKTLLTSGSGFRNSPSPP